MKHRIINLFSVGAAVGQLIVRNASFFFFLVLFFLFVVKSICSKIYCSVYTELIKKTHAHLKNTSRTEPARGGLLTNVTL